MRRYMVGLAGKKILFFDGNDYVELRGDAFDFSRYDEFTILVLVRRTKPGFGGFIGYHPGVNEKRSPGMWFHPSERDFHWGFGDGENWLASHAYNVLGVDKWFFLGIRWSYATGRLEGLVNGRVVGWVDTGKSRPYPNTVYHIGRVDNWHTGFIALVLIYSRFLDDEKIARLKNDAFNLRPASIRDGLVLELLPDTLDCTNGVWRDNSGHGNDGVIYGAKCIAV